MSSFIADNACFSPLLGDPSTAALFSADRTISHCIDFEKALAKALADHGLVEQQIAMAAMDKMDSFTPDPTELGLGSLSDGLPIPRFVALLKQHVGPDLVGAIHVGATSQDLLDTALVLSLRELSDTLALRLEALIKTLDDLTGTFGKREMMGRTRMQAALPITAGDRLTSWRMPLAEQLDALAQVRASVEQLQFGGAVGTRHALGDKGDLIAAQLANHFGLGNPSRAWHSARSSIAGYGDWLATTTGVLGKIGMDVCLMAQQGVDEIKLSGSGGSSAMPHKQNPVLAEILVTFARFNAVQVSGLHHAVVHEQERSGMAWTLEWMILPLMAETTGAALSHAHAITEQVEWIGKP